MVKAHEPHYQSGFEYFFEYLVPKTMYIFSGTPLALVAGVVAGWAYLGYYLLRTRNPIVPRNMAGGWMLSVFVGFCTYKLMDVYFVQTGMLHADIGLLTAMVLGSTGATGYKKLVRVVNRLFPDDES